MAIYRKKPVVIEAFQWKGGPDQKEDPQWIVDKIKNEEVFIQLDSNKDAFLIIRTLEGLLTAELGDFIVKGVEGEIYPVKPRIFYKTYERVIQE